MSDLVGLGADIELPDVETAGGSSSHDAGSGRLAELAQWLASVQGRAAVEIRRARILVAGTRSCPVDIADLAGATTLTLGPDELLNADPIAAGARLIDAEVDGGADLFVLAVPDSDVAAMTLISVITNTEPVKVMPRGAGLSPQSWIAQTVAVRDGRRAAVEMRDDPLALLQAVDAPALSASVGMLLRAAARRTPVVLDGLGAVAAATVAHAVQPRVARWLQVADRANLPAVDIALAKLGNRPLLDLGIGTADGTAGALAVLVLRAAVLEMTRPISS
jgi:NaMN:DMB phosphoribosyltransferase